MKKFLSILLAMAMIIALVPAALAEGAPEPITVTVFRGDPGDQPTDDNKIYKMIEDQFGIKFEFEFLSGNLDETLGLKIADEDSLPDLFDGGNSAETLENAGVLIDLLPYITEEGTPNLYKHIYTDDRIKQLLTEDGKLYIIPNYGINYNDQIQNACNGPAFFIQKQVIAWNNYEVPKTLNQYFDLIERFMAANPTTADGTPYTGFAILCEGWRHFCLINPVQHLMGRTNGGEVLINVDSGNWETETFIDKPYAKAYYKKLNEAFHAGLIKQSTFTMSYDQYIADLSNGIVLGMFDQAWDFGTATSALQDAKKYDRTYVALGLVYDPEDVGGVEIEEHYLNGSLPNVRRGFGISVNCPDPKRVVDMWEELLSDEWQIILNWGIEGEDYYVEDGRLNMTEEQYAHTQDATWKLANKADAIFQSSPKKQGWIMNDITLPSGTVIKAGNCWEPGNQDEIVFGLMNDYDQDFLAAYGYSKFADFVNPPIELAPYGEAWQINYTPVEAEHDNFLKVQDIRLPELIMCAPEEFDAKWDAFVAEIKPYADAFADYMQGAVIEEANKVLQNAD